MTTQNKTTHNTTIVTLLLFTIGILLPCNTFAKKPAKPTHPLAGYTVGDTGPAGGKVFYTTDAGLHGLEAAPVDQSDAAPWGCKGTPISGAYGIAVGTGAKNTAAILAGCSEAGIAAKIADDYSLNGYTDWFLPSRDELSLLNKKKDVVGGFANFGYWSSTEFAKNNGYRAGLQLFSLGFPGEGDKNLSLRVRAIRAF